MNTHYNQVKKKIKSSELVLLNDALTKKLKAAELIVEASSSDIESLKYENQMLLADKNELWHDLQEKSCWKRIKKWIR